MNDMNALVSRNVLGIGVLIGVVILFFAHIILMLPILTTCGALFFLLITALFLHQPLYGFLTIIFVRASVDIFASDYSLTITENIQLNIAGAFALLLIATTSILFLHKRHDFLHIPLFIPFSIFIFFTAFSYIYSIDTNATLQETLRVLSIFASFATAYVLCINIPTARKTIITAILLTAALPLSLAVLQLVTDTGFSDNLGTDGRLYGTFKHPNSFASFLLIIITILIYRIFSRDKNAINKNTTIILLGVTLVLMLLTFSRGGWFALIIFFALFSIFRAPKILFITVIFAIVIFFTSQTVHDRIEDIYNPPADSSIRWRAEQWKNAIAAWQLSPIYGYGAGTEIAIFEHEQGFYAGNPYTHNDLIKALQETGVIGLVLFTGLLLTTFILLIKKYLNLPHNNTQLFVLTIALLFIAETAFGMSSNIWRGTAVQWILWTLIACALSLNAQKKSLPIST